MSIILSTYDMNQDAFQSYTLQHGLPILVMAIIGIIVIWVGRSVKEDTTKRWIGLGIGSNSFIGVFVRGIYCVSIDQFYLSEELPLHLCRILALIAPFAMYYKNRKWLGILYFMILAGTLQANITPDLDAGFPTAPYFAYWMMHTSLLIIPFYAIFVYKIRINYSDLKNAFVAINIYLVAVTLLNLVLGANYFYTLRKPASASLLDLFGPWPLYILVAWFICILFFLILYLPFYLKRPKAVKDD